MGPRGPTWPRNDPRGTETSHTGPCSLNVAQLARSIGWVLFAVIATAQWPIAGKRSQNVHFPGIEHRQFCELSKILLEN